MLKSIQSALLWAVGGLHFGVVFLLVASGLMLLDAQTIFPMVRILAKSQLGIMGLRLKVLGLEHIKNSRTYLMMGNHESLFDAFALPAALPGHAVGIEAANHFNWPLWGYLTRKWGNIPVTRSNLARAIDSLKQAKKAIDAGTSVVVLPEGHRTPTGQIGDFKKGPFHLAKDTEADILPFVMIGLYEFNNKHSWHLNPGTAQVVFGEPILYQSVKHLSVEALRSRVRQSMVQLKESAVDSNNVRARIK